MSNTMSGCEAGEGSTPKKRSRTRSTVWEHFTKANDGTSAKCNYCKKSLSYTRGTTTHLMRHHNSCNEVPNGGIARTLTIAENNERAAMNQPPTVAFGEEDRNFAEKIWEFQVKNAILAAFYIAPPNFKKVWSNSMVMDMEKEILAYHQREKDKLVAELGNLTSRVCFSFEIMEETGWISITAHFINDEFNLVKRLIGFKKLPDYTSELCEADIIESCISDWKLGNKIFSFTTKWDDDLMGSFTEKFRSKMLLHGEHDRYLFLPCFKNAMVEFYSKAQTDISNDEDKLINIIKKIVTSPIGRLKFNEIAEEKGLPPINEEWSKDPPISRYAGNQDWKFCYSAVKIAKEAFLYKEVLCERSLTEICQYDPGNISWTKLETAVNFLETINPIIDLLSNSKYPTSNLYCPSHDKIDGTVDHTEIFLSIPHTYQIMNILCVACVLDPRYKLIFFEYFLGNVHSNLCMADFWPVSTGQVRDFFDIMFSRYAKEKPNQTSSLSIGTSSTQEHLGSIYSDPDLLTHVNSYPLYIKELRTTKREMDQYLREEVIDKDTNFDLLGWWKENRSRYPVLSRMARDLLAVPACVYSVKESLRIDLSALQEVNPELAEAVICSKNWILSDG